MDQGIQGLIQGAAVQSSLKKTPHHISGTNVFAQALNIVMGTFLSLLAQSMRVFIKVNKVNQRILALLTTPFSK